MDIQWKYWWDHSRWISLKGSAVMEDTLHVAGKLGQNAYGITVKGDVRHEALLVRAAKQHITAKLNREHHERPGLTQRL